MHAACAFRVFCVASVPRRCDDAAVRRTPRTGHCRVNSASAASSTSTSTSSSIFRVPVSAAAAAPKRGVACRATRAYESVDTQGRRWSRGDTPGDAPGEPGPVTRRTGDCYGCGVALQTDFPDVSGYVPLLEYQTKKHHRQLTGALLCARCGDLSHGHMVNAVAGQGGARVGAGLITPIQLRDSLMHIREKKALVVKVVDATDFHGCFLNKVRDVVGSNPILLVLTKVDLLPPDTDLTKLQDWVVHEVTHKRRLTLAGVVCVSSRKNTNMKQAVQTMFAERKGRDVYVLGSANVGKSTFIRAALKAMREEGNYGVPGKRLPTASAMPGTTLGVIPLRAFEGKGTMFDTPGVFLHHRLNSILTGNDLKRFGLGSSLKRFQARPRVGDETEDRKDGFKGLSLLWGPLLRVDVTDATPNAGLVFFGPKGMRITVVETNGLPSASSITEKETRDKEARRAEARDDLENNADETLRVPSDFRDAVGDASSSKEDRFIQRLVKEAYVTAESSPGSESDEPRNVNRQNGNGAALRDLSVSGMNAWLRVTHETETGPCSMRLSVFGPRGLEVFDREPMPVT